MRFIFNNIFLVVVFGRLVGLVVVVFPTTFDVNCFEFFAVAFFRNFVVNLIIAFVVAFVVNFIIAFVVAFVVNFITAFVVGLLTVEIFFEIFVES